MIKNFKFKTYNMLINLYEAYIILYIYMPLSNICEPKIYGGLYVFYTIFIL